VFINEEKVAFSAQLTIHCGVRQSKRDRGIALSIIQYIGYVLVIVCFYFDFYLLTADNWSLQETIFIFLSARLSSRVTFTFTPDFGTGTTHECIDRTLLLLLLDLQSIYVHNAGW